MGSVIKVRPDGRSPLRPPAPSRRAGRAGGGAALAEPEGHLRVFVDEGVSAHLGAPTCGIRPHEDPTRRSHLRRSPGQRPCVASGHKQRQANGRPPGNGNEEVAWSHGPRSETTRTTRSACTSRRRRTDGQPHLIGRHPARRGGSPARRRARRRRHRRQAVVPRGCSWRAQPPGTTSRQPAGAANLLVGSAPRGIRTPNRQVRSYNITRESRQSQ
jgi:hypothetical protein